MSRPHIAELSVKDLALVSELRLELGPGLTVLTGETGAGKSMLVDALLAATGGRVAAGMVREGADRAKVEAVFAGVGDDELVLTREIQVGRAPARINGETVPLAKLAESGGDLVAVHGQGEQLRLARPAVQRDLLDAYGGHERSRAAVLSAHRALRDILAERASLGGDPRERARRLALLEHEVSEIAGARIEADEEATLAAALAVARSAERLRTSAASVHELLVGERGSARDRLALAARDLSAAAEIDPRLTDQATRLAASVDEVADLGADLRRYAESIDADPRELERLESRNDALAELRRKYGPSLDDVIAYGERARRELSDVSTQEARLARLDGAQRTADDALVAASAALHTAREKSAKKLGKSVEVELAELGLARCRFTVALEPIEPDASGADRVTFRIAPNPGEPFAPLQEIASGGELSRIMLALEVVLAAQDDTPVLVFDEVDAGVGGRLGEVVGRALWSLARQHQVLCVSHLAQVAAYADAHIKVRKEVRGGRTHVVAERLGTRDSAAELADMVGAGGSSRSLAAGARELQSGAADWKAKARRP
ncbi:MAG TPA: DNA repair protein RecN [Candidatus Saccharimonadales bacterium]|nr:DNA repair protein RecN [Candidatus Saccharimonadales bacterium]